MIEIGLSPIVSCQALDAWLGMRCTALLSGMTEKHGMAPKGDLERRPTETLIKVGAINKNQRTD